MNKRDKIFETLLEIGHEIAAMEGAGDTGLGGGEYEIFITRGGFEYRVTVEAYWDNEADEPLRESV